MRIFARRNEDLSFHIIQPISVPTRHVTGLGEAVQNGKGSNLSTCTMTAQDI